MYDLEIRRSMKINIVTITFLLILCCSGVSPGADVSGYAMEGKERISKPRFKAKIVFLDRRIVTGYFVKVAHDSVHLLDPRTNDVARIPVTDIRIMKLRRKGTIWKGALIGAGTGLATAILLTSASLKDPCNSCDEGNEEFAYVIGGILGYGYGGLTGMLIGMHQKKIKMNGHLEGRKLKRLERFNAKAAG